ncbi:hypothetical protein [Paracidovorax avenae]|uniref:hypothetical protein n=1 Tax=Paracidovorax avenae TaxID=80867 RepID=UPI000D22CA09|nr:hypothetical protein [Paracidovorax avenae]AVT13661.1 hypothetical protein C8235_12775 [Paracidovorax avenae]
MNADLLQNTLLNWSLLYAAAARNRAALATMDAAEKMGVAYPVQEGTKGAVKVVTIERLRAEIGHRMSALAIAPWRGIDDRRQSVEAAAAGACGGLRRRASG